MKMDVNATEHMMVTFVECAGINDNLASTFMNIYPNPAENVIQLEAIKELSGDSRIIIVDAYGKQVYIEENVVIDKNITKTLNVNNLQNGVYFLIFENKHISFNQKLVIQKIKMNN